MNRLSNEERARVISCLVEGNSIRATVRLTGASKNTIAKLLRELGAACSVYQDKVFRNLNCKRLQCDEIWSFVGCKEKNITANNKDNGWGDCWTWTAICADSKLIPCWFVGTRDGSAAYHFMHDLAERLANRVQLTTDDKKLRLSIVDTDGKPVMPTLETTISVRFPLSESTATAGFVLIMQQIALPSFGEYSIDLAIDGRLEASTPLYAAQIQPPAGLEQGSQ